MIVPTIIRIACGQITTFAMINSNCLGRTSDGERKSSKESKESLKERTSLLAHRRKVAADASESGDAILAAESPRNLLLNFNHAKIGFSLIVGKRDCQVIEEGQHLMSS